MDINSDTHAAIISERPLAGTEGQNVPYFFTGVEGFALNKNILRPFGGSKLSAKLPLVQSTRVCGLCFWNFGQ